MDQILSLAMFAAMLRISVPYVLAALGGVWSERSGVINIALEGMILNGAFAATLMTHHTHSPLAGAVAGMAGGAITALLYAVAVIRFRADQIVSGIAINLLAVGMTRFLLKVFFGSTSNSGRIEGLAPSAQAGSSFGAFIGSILGNPLIIATVLIVWICHKSLFGTPFGLRVRAVGEHPQAAETLAVSVHGVRYRAVVLSGVLAGLGGAWLALDQHQFTDLMSGGRGYIALAAVIFGNWRPLPATAACLLFAAAEALQIALQASGAEIPTQLVQMLPYVLTMIALAGAVGRSRAPVALGRPY